MKRTKRTFLLLLLCITLALSASITSFATGSGNIDSGSGGMGEGTDTDVWRNNMDGVRITVVKTDGTIVSTPFDLTNFNVEDDTIHFGKVCKLEYTAGTSLSPGTGSYVCSKPGTALPRIISGGKNKASIEAIKRYFCSEYAAQLVADKSGIPFQDLISGSYKLVIEPMAYFVHGGLNYAMTATEAALYNQLSEGKLRKKLTSLTHQNLPLALFLEQDDLGYPAWTGTTSGKVSDDQIITALGIGIVSYADVPEAELQAPDYTYRVNTDVITSITVSSTREVNPDNPASVTFHINGGTYTVNNIVMPAGGSQVVWVKWHTPATPVSIPIDVTVTGAATAKTNFIARIVSLEENIPPDPLATDTNPRFNVASLPATPQKTHASWSVWSAYWEPKWEWEADWVWEEKWEWKENWVEEPFWYSIPKACYPDCEAENLDACIEEHRKWLESTHEVDKGEWVDNGPWVDKGEWVDNGKYIFTSTSYVASINASMEVHPDDIVPTAVGDTMKSGYGIKEIATAQFLANAPSSHYTPVQTAITYFPEFEYQTYWRLLMGNGGNPATFTFKPNEYSTYGRSVHFTPVWYPDNTPYTVYTHVIDAWTPSGMLSVNINDSIYIQGSMFDDWYSKRE